MKLLHILLKSLPFKICSCSLVGNTSTAGYQTVYKSRYF